MGTHKLNVFFTLFSCYTVIEYRMAAQRNWYPNDTPNVPHLNAHTGPTSHGHLGYHIRSELL